MALRLLLVATDRGARDALVRQLRDGGHVVRVVAVPDLGPVRCDAVVLPADEARGVLLAMRTYADLLHGGLAAWHARDWLEAARLARAAIGIEPRAPAFNLLGAATERLQGPIEAQSFYRAAIALDPTYRAAAQNLERVTSMPVLDAPAV